jgi:hypothetical protein
MPNSERPAVIFFKPGEHYYPTYKEIGLKSLAIAYKLWVLDGVGRLARSLFHPQSYSDQLADQVSALLHQQPRMPRLLSIKAPQQKAS